MAETGQQKSDEIEHLSKNKKELILGLAWYIFYFMLSYISCAFQVDLQPECFEWVCYIPAAMAQGLGHSNIGL